MKDRKPLPIEPGLEPAPAAVAALDEGVALWNVGQTTAALTRLEAAQKAGPYDSIVHYWSALCHKALGFRRKARRDIETLLAVEPHKVEALCVRDNLDAEADRRRRRGRSGKRILFHLDRPFHYGLLRPLFDRLRHDHVVLLSKEPPEFIAFRPEVTVICDAQAANLRKLMGETTIVNICHGVGVDTGFAARGTADADFICVTGPAEGAQLRQLTGLPDERIWITGFIDTDLLFRGDKPALPIVLPAAGKTLLYAPHFRPEYSSVPMVQGDMTRLLTGDRDDIHVITRPHPRILESGGEWLEWFRDNDRRHPNFHLIEAMDFALSALMPAADVLVSDVSSSAFQFLALDRPIVLVDNPARLGSDGGADPLAIRNAWRDVGEDIGDVSQLGDAVGRALDGPDRFAEARARRRGELFGDLTDGRAAERIAERIATL